MEQNAATSQSGSGSLLLRFWRRLPVVVRAVLVSFAVAVIGPLGTGIPMQVNMKLLPNIPWSVPIAADY